MLIGFPCSSVYIYFIKASFFFPHRVDLVQWNTVWIDRLTKEERKPIQSTDISLNFAKMLKENWMTDP